MPDVLSFTQQFPYAGLFIFLILGGLGLPLPEDITLMACGFLLFHGMVKPVPALLVVYAGLLLADMLVYWFGRANGERITGHRWFKKFISQPRLARMEESFRKRGVWYIIFGRHLLGLRVQLFLSAGVMKMPLHRFIAADGFSATITIAIMTGLGYMGASSFDALRRDVARAEHYLALCLLAGLAIFFIAKTAARKKAGSGRA